MYIYLFECTSIWSKNYNRAIWIIADDNTMAYEKTIEHGFDWTVMKRYNKG